MNLSHIPTRHLPGVIVGHLYPKTLTRINHKGFDLIFLQLRNTPDKACVVWLRAHYLPNLWFLLQAGSPNMVLASLDSCLGLLIIVHRNPAAHFPF